MAQSPTIKKINVATATFPYNVNLDSNTKHYKLYGTKTLGSNISISFTGTPAEGMEVHFDFTATFTGNYTLSVFGTTIPKMLNSTNCLFVCKYNAGAWGVYVLMSVDGLDGEIGNIIIVGETGIEPLDASANGGVIIGDGTTINVRVLTGDVTVNSAGTTAIGTDKVLAAMIKDGELVDAHFSASAAIAVSKLAALTASRAVTTDGSGKMQASAVTSTELGYLAGVTSSVQTQIDTVAADLTSEVAALDARITSGLSRTTWSEISADTTATAATLSDAYMIKTSAGKRTLTLPLGSTLPLNTTVRITRLGGNDAALKPNAADHIFPISSTTVDVAEVTCSADAKSILAVLRAVDEWQVIQAD